MHEGDEHAEGAEQARRIETEKAFGSDGFRDRQSGGRRMCRCRLRRMRGEIVRFAVAVRKEPAVARIVLEQERSAYAENGRNYAQREISVAPPQMIDEKG